MPNTPSSGPTPLNNPTLAIQQMLTKVHLCKKDVSKIQKYLKTQKGGGCGCDQTGGKQKTKKMKGTHMKGKHMKGKHMKGGEGTETKESYIDFAGKDGLEELDEDTNGPDLDITAVEKV